MCFEHPEYLVFFWGFPLLIAASLYGWLRKRYLLSRLCDEGLQEHMVVTRHPLHEVAIRLAQLLAAASFLIALAVPIRCSVTPGGADVVYVVDISMSMGAADVYPDRIGRARREIMAIEAGRYSGGRIALVGFAASAAVFCPMTADREAFAFLLRGLSPHQARHQGTDIGRALELAASMLPDGGAIVLVTDGEDHGGGAVAAARSLSARGIATLVIGMGGEDPVRIPGTFPEEEVTSSMDRQLLDTLALETGGQAIYPVDDADAAATARKMLRAHSVRDGGDVGVLADVDPCRAAMLSGIVLLMAAIGLQGGRCWQVAGKNVKFSSGPEGFQEV